MFGVLSALFAQCLLMFLICFFFFFFLLTHRSNPGSRFFCVGVVCVCLCVCVCASVATNKHTWQQKTVLLERKKGGPHPYRLSQKNTGEDDICFLFFFVSFIFSGSHFASHARLCHRPSSKICGWHRPGFVVFVLLFPRHQLQRSVLLAPSHNTVQ